MRFRYRVLRTRGNRNVLCQISRGAICLVYVEARRCRRVVRVLRVRSVSDVLMASAAPRPHLSM